MTYVDIKTYLIFLTCSSIAIPLHASFAREPSIIHWDCQNVCLCVCVSLIAPHATEFNDRATHHAKSRTVWEHDIRNMWYCPWRFQFATVLADSGFWLNVAVTVTVAAATTNHNIFRCGIDHKSERTLAAVELCTHSPSIYIYIYFF